MHFQKQITFKKSQTFPEVLEYCSKKFEAVYNLIGKHVGKISVQISLLCRIHGLLTLLRSKTALKGQGKETKRRVRREGQM